MKRFLFELPRTGAATALVLAFLCTPLLAETCFVATINGAQAGTGSTATGIGKLMLNDAETELAYNITFQGLSATETASHIHSDAEGGAPLKDTGLGTPKIGTWRSTDAIALTPARVADLKAGLMYVNIHSTAFPGGEIAGRILVTSCQEQCFTAAINGSATGSPGTGTGWLALNHTETELAYWIEFSGLLAPETGAHIHSNAEGGAIVHPLSTGTPKVGVWKFTDSPALTAARVVALKAGQLYVNIHSTLNPGGEISGTIAPTECRPQCFEAALDGAQAGTTSQATAHGSFRLSHARNYFDYFVSMDTPLQQTGAHIHDGSAGGAVVVDIGTGTVKVGQWDIDDAVPLNVARVNALMSGAMYVNVHTAAFPNGEIRGQINPFACAVTDVGEVPKRRTILSQNHPNPFNPTTTIEFTLASPVHVSLAVYDVAGRLVSTLVEGPAEGTRVVEWNGRDGAGRPVGSGVYYYRLIAGDFRESRAMVLLK